MIKDIVTSLPLTLSSPHMTKNSTPSSKSSHSFHVYMLSKDCIYSGGGYGGQSVNVMYTIDSTAEDPIVKIFGTSMSGSYEEVVHINDIDPTNATYPELCALLAHQQRIGAYTSGANKLLIPTPLNVDPGDYSKRMDYISLIRDSLSNSNYVDLTNSTQKLLDFFERYLSKNLEKPEKFSILMQTSVYKGYKQDKIEMRGDRAEMSDFPLYLNTVAGGLDRRDQTIGGFSFVVKIYAVPVVEIIG